VDPVALDRFCFFKLLTYQTILPNVNIYYGYIQKYYFKRSKGRYKNRTEKMRKTTCNKYPQNENGH